MPSDAHGYETGDGACLEHAERANGDTFNAADL